jgi:hypothetical protein
VYFVALKKQFSSMCQNVPEEIRKKGQFVTNEVKSAYEKVYVSFQGRNNKKSITEVTEDVILAFLDMW